MLALANMQNPFETDFFRPKFPGKMYDLFVLTNEKSQEILPFFR